MITGPHTLVERNVREQQVIAQVALSRCCKVPLQGSATRWCGDCGATISAADLDHETHAPVRGVS